MSEDKEVLELTYQEDIMEEEVQCQIILTHNGLEVEAEPHILQLDRDNFQV